MFEPKVNRNRSLTSKNTKLFEYSSNCIDNVVEFADKLKEFYETHDSVEVYITNDGYDDDGMSIVAYWLEPETDDEMNARIKREEQRVKEWEAREADRKKLEKELKEKQKSSDYAELERLMRNFSKKEIMDMMKRTRNFRADDVEK